MSQTLRTPLSVIAAISITLSTTNSHSAVTLYDQDGWQANLSGSFPVFLVNSNVDDGEQATRIMSGFNPTNLTFGVNAPKENGVAVSGKMQINNHLQGTGTQNSGLWESRVAEIQIDGDFGTVNVGKGFGIFNSSAIGDTGSGLGIGLIGGNISDTGGGATAGRIGTGYVYANFNPRIMYSNKSGGVSYKVGLFNPEEPTGGPLLDENTENAVTETPTPRMEGQINFTMGSTEVWAGFMYQSVTLNADVDTTDGITEDEDYTIQGYDIGARLNTGSFGGTVAYTVTKGIGADGLYGFGGPADAEVDGTQWYVEGTYLLNKTVYGASYGQGSQDENDDPYAAPEIVNTLTMIFAHHRVTSHLRTMFEFHTYKSENKTADTEGEYSAVIVGAQLDF